MSLIINSKEIEAIFFDFDGVFTNNKVWTSSTGDEFVVCSKKDSLGIDIFRQFLDLQKIELRMAIISREKNSVVEYRAKKLNLECHSGISDKVECIDGIFKTKRNSYIFFGNDSNDIGAMKGASLSLAPSDAEPDVLAVASFIGKQRGGEGFVREGLEYITSLIEKG